MIMPQKVLYVCLLFTCFKVVWRKRPSSLQSVLLLPLFPVQSRDQTSFGKKMLRNILGLSATQSWTNCRPPAPICQFTLFSVQLFLTFISMSSVCDLNKILRAQLLIFQTKKANLCYIWYWHIIINLIKHWYFVLKQHLLLNISI